MLRNYWDWLSMDRGFGASYDDEQSWFSILWLNVRRNGRRPTQLNVAVVFTWEFRLHSSKAKSATVRHEMNLTK